MEVKNLDQQGNTLQGEVCFEHASSKIVVELCSEQYVCGAVLFQIKVTSIQCKLRSDSTCNFIVTIFFRIEKLIEDDDLEYICKLTCNNINVNLVTSNQNVWHQMYFHQEDNFDFSMYKFSLALQFRAHIDLAAGKSYCARLYKDTEFTDFELHGEDEGTVKMHKAILMGSSPVLHKMLCGKWKETTQGAVDVAGTSKETLEHLKDYIYLNKLPETGFKELLAFACYYDMPDLELKCSVKLMNTLNNDNFMELAEFAVKCNAKKMFLGMLKQAQKNETITLKNLKCIDDGIKAKKSDILKVISLDQQGNSLKGEFRTEHNTSDRNLEYSENYLCGAVLFEMKVISSRWAQNTPEYTVHIFAKFFKILKDDNLKYSCKLICNDVSMDLLLDNGWHQVFLRTQNLKSTTTFKLCVLIDIALDKSPFESLYEDTESIDFELYKEGKGGVKMHRTILMASSPDFHKKLTGEWKDTTQGAVDVAAISKETLEHLKDYIYLNKLPETGLKELLALACYYEMPELELKCSVKLLDALTNENIIELAELAVLYKADCMFSLILKHIQMNQSITLKV